MPSQQSNFTTGSMIASDVLAGCYQSENGKENKTSLYLDGYLGGSVFEANGETPIEGAIVKVWQYSYEVGRCTTDYQGHYSITLDVGYYWLEISKEGYQTEFQFNIYIPPDWTRIVIFRLERNVDINDAQTLPHAFRLDQNYPNPFNASTTISFSLKAYGPVELEIFDITGAKITTLIDAPMVTGNHQVTWNASDDASGVYYYRLTAGDISETRQAVLIK